MERDTRQIHHDMLKAELNPESSGLFSNLTFKKCITPIIGLWFHIDELSKWNMVRQEYQLERNNRFIMLKFGYGVSELMCKYT